MLVTSDDVVVVAEPDLASLRNAKNIVDLIRAARPNDAPPRVVLNKVGLPGRPEIPLKDFGEALGLTPCMVVAFDAKLFGQAANNGQMIAEVGPKSKAGREPRAPGPDDQPAARPARRPRRGPPRSSTASSREVAAQRVRQARHRRSQQPARQAPPPAAAGAPPIATRPQRVEAPPAAGRTAGRPAQATRRRRRPTAGFEQLQRRPGGPTRDRP